MNIFIKIVQALHELFRKLLRHPFYFTIGLLVIFLAFLLNNFNKRYQTSDAILEEYQQTSIQLVEGFSKARLADILVENGYVDSLSTAQFIAAQLSEKLYEGTPLESIYELKKRYWQISASTIEASHSTTFKQKLQESEENIGIDSLYFVYQAMPLSSQENLALGDREIQVSVKEIREMDNGKEEDFPCPNILVRLYEYQLITNSSGENQVDRKAIAHLKTDSLGIVSFQGLEDAKNYAVVPISKGYEFGALKSFKAKTDAQASSFFKRLFSLEESEKASFTKKEHKIRIFDTLVLKQIKDDHRITVRSLQTVVNTILIYFVLFFVLWIGVYWANRKTRTEISEKLISLLMFITGLCLLNLFSINNPLVDNFIAGEMFPRLLLGIFVVFLLQKVDILKWYEGKYFLGFDILYDCIVWLFLPFEDKTKLLRDRYNNPHSSQIIKFFSFLGILFMSPFYVLDLFHIYCLHPSVKEAFKELPKGSSYLVLAVLLTALLFTPFGKEINGMRVNLDIPLLPMFQPSEISKYLLAFFLAAFFTTKADSTISYSEQGNMHLFGSKIKMLSWLILGLAILMGIYLALGDLGPGLVIAFSTIFIYSTIKSKSKSKVSEKNQLAEAFTCDIAMLVYGVVSFLLCLYAGHLLGMIGLFAILWFALWIAWGISKKQVYESALLFNLIISLFIFGGDLLRTVPSFSEGTAARLEARNEMCTNTWGVLPIDGALADPCSNTQVVEGLWGIASGGLTGQGFAYGSPSLIPAFHTDMILESVGEQLGWLGILLILAVHLSLFITSLRVGYRTAHPFTFYLCLGIAITTMTQLLIISFGSLGIIPLTGVAFPLLSYGGVSMIVNLFAFGLVLSIETHTDAHLKQYDSEIRKRREQQMAVYNLSGAITNVLVTMLLLVVLFTCFHYQFVTRSSTLIRPVYVNNREGVPVVQYNPRIGLLTNKLHSGDIYDRNHVLLATSNKHLLSKEANLSVYKKCKLQVDSVKCHDRYYPFAEHLYYTLGDYNTKTFFSSVATSPRGYLAEARHLATLRGYDNILRNQDDEPILVDLVSHEYRPSNYLADKITYRVNHFQLRDYSALVPYLKQGLYSEKVARVNERSTSWLEFDRIKPKDIQLTVDAVLQTRLQQGMIPFAEKLAESDRFKSHHDWNKMRISVVVLDAEDGDLLASAIYPLANQEKVRKNPEYNDNRRDRQWKAYSDRDMGLTFATAPGSTAKVISALAGLKEMGDDAAEETYHIYPSQQVGLEPVDLTIDMKTAIIQSSNCFFINLINDHNLYEPLAELYDQVGVRINNTASYGLFYANPSESSVRNYVQKKGAEGVKRYQSYREEFDQLPSYQKNQKSSVEHGKWKLNKADSWWWTWGQGSLSATPLTMARAASIVVNEGEMPVTRYLMDDKKESVSVLDASDVQYLKSYMQEAADKKYKLNNPSLGAKTGTAERVLKTTSSSKNKVNDGWYLLFKEKASPEEMELDPSRYPHSIAIAIRMERLGEGGSNQAVYLAKDLVLPLLDELSY